MQIKTGKKEDSDDFFRFLLRKSGSVGLFFSGKSGILLVILFTSTPERAEWKTVPQKTL